MKTHYRVLRVAAYCRVSTKQEEQLNSYENQVEHYTECINSENGWTLEGIYADKGISGTSVKNRDEFNRMIRRCKHRLTRAHREKQLKMSCQALHNAPPNRT